MLKIKWAILGHICAISGGLHLINYFNWEISCFETVKVKQCCYWTRLPEMGLICEQADSILPTHFSGQWFYGVRSFHKEPLRAKFKPLSDDLGLWLFLDMSEKYTYLASLTADFLLIPLNLWFFLKHYALSI